MTRTVKQERRRTMNGSKIAAMVAGIVMIVCVVFAVGLLLLKALWAWTVPDLFPGAVQQGLVAGSISWGTAAKVALFLAVLSGGRGARDLRYHNQKTGIHIGEKE
jgi:uncharacterized membrane protein